ncbi:unnamed protein product [Ambrosiozyma monospora]|uniref:Unnamed protein product n=1 Tax=Ambrosiozyma monospora TaxID=43982 RepID=A0A9W6YNJ9_AMBMO|nr:unnamed protein product [Ambrosiozyma monospora]
MDAAAITTTAAPMQPILKHQSKGIDITTSESPGPGIMSKLIDLRTLHYVSTPEHLNCPICQCPFINPYTTICGHTFCKACIVEALKSPMGSKCPLDRTELWWHGQNQNCDEKGNGFDDPVVNAFIETFIEDEDPDNPEVQQAIANYHNGSVRQRRAVWRLFNSVETTVEESDEPITSEIVRNLLLHPSEGDQSQEEDNNNEEYDEDESNDDIFPAPIIISNITDDLQVYCCNEERGCDWIGPRWNIQSHVLDECGFTRFVCGKVKLDGSICRVLTQRRFLADDADSTENNNGNDDEPIEGQTDNGNKNKTSKNKQQGCPHDLFPCEKCSKMVSQVDLEWHLDTECDENHLKCHGCSLEIPKKSFKKHEDTCVKIHIECPGSIYGCDWRGRRDLLEEVHVKQCVFVKLTNYFESQQTKMDKLTEEKTVLKNQLSTVLDSVIQGRLTNLGYPLQVEEVNSNSGGSNPNNISSAMQNLSTRLSNIGLDDADYVHLVLEFERLRADMERLRPMMAEFEINKQIVNSLVNENAQLKDELTSHRMALNSVKQQIQFMLLERRRVARTGSSNNGQSPAGGAGGSRLKL